MMMRTVLRSGRVRFGAVNAVGVVVIKIIIRISVIIAVIAVGVGVGTSSAAVAVVAGTADGGIRRRFA